MIKTMTDSYFNEKARILGNCYLVIEGIHTYHYEFQVKGNEALVLCDEESYLEDVVTEYHKHNLHIYKYFTQENSFFMTFDQMYTFKLPISILQVTNIFLDQSHLDTLRKYLPLETIVYPVQIIEDEYVILDKHHSLYLAQEDGMKMVDVYVDESICAHKGYLYLAKEQNIKTVKHS